MLPPDPMQTYYKDALPLVGSKCFCCGSTFGPKRHEKKAATKMKINQLDQYFCNACYRVEPPAEPYYLLYRGLFRPADVARAAMSVKD